jgi:hypothetical protein
MLKGMQPNAPQQPYQGTPPQGSGPYPPLPNDSGPVLPAPGGAARQPTYAAPQSGHGMYPPAPYPAPGIRPGVHETPQFPEQAPQVTAGDYNFINDIGPVVQKPPLGLAILANVSRTKLLVAGIVGILFIMIISTVIGLSMSGGTAATAGLIDVASQQTELIRLGEEGGKKAQGPEARYLAATIKLTAQNDLNNSLALLKSQNIKGVDKQLGGARNPKVDQALTTAEQNNRFDEIYMEVMRAALKSYQTKLKAANAIAETTGEKKVLAESYLHINMILDGVNSAGATGGAIPAIVAPDAAQ